MRRRYHVVDWLEIERTTNKLISEKANVSFRMRELEVLGRKDVGERSLIAEESTLKPSDLTRLLS